MGWIGRAGGSDVAIDGRREDTRKEDEVSITFGISKFLEIRVNVQVLFLRMAQAVACSALRFALSINHQYHKLRCIRAEIVSR